MISLDDPRSFTAKAANQNFETYSLHRRALKKFPTRTVRSKKFNDFMQADLNEMHEYAKENDNYNYILTAIDVYSRYAYARPLKNKTAACVIKAFKSIFTENDGQQPLFLQTDEGREFENKYFREFLGDKTKQFSVKSQFKACIVERFNRSLKERMFRYFTHTNSRQWIHVLQKFVDGYNNSVHRTIGMTPMQAKKPKMHKKILDSQAKRVMSKKIRVLFKKGDYVRLSKQKKLFEKGYTPRWTREIFIVEKVSKKYPPVMYSVKDRHGEVIAGKFYNQELQKVKKPDDYIVEKILQVKPTKSLVKFKGYTKPEWVKNIDLKWI